MEYLVSMTTHVPEGTHPEAVDEIRAREAVRARELAAAGNLLRLWRPPLRPGEWRTLGLFAAEDGDRLEALLATMPLRVWRTDDVTPLSPHPNDAASRVRGEGVEFLVWFEISVPEGTPAAEVDERNRAEESAAAGLASAGHLARVWRLPVKDAGTQVLGLYRAADDASLRSLLGGLPLAGWMRTPLSVHPSDPALAAG